MQRDDLFFKNLDALENTLTVATFWPQGVNGTWIVDQDDLYNSDAFFKDQFMLVEDDEDELTVSSVVFKIKDYDMVGPEDFHADRSLDKLRDDWGKPYLSIDIKFKPADKEKDTLNLKLVYPLEERHLMIARAKRDFRSSKPKVAHVSLNDGFTTKECDGLNFSFQVRNSYVKYVLDDQTDNCFPYTVEGKWHLNMTGDEELEQLVENAVKEDISHMTETEKEDMITDNDVLIDDIESELSRLTDDQLELLKDVANGNDTAIDEHRQKQKDKWSTNHVDHDINSKRGEQKDWYQRGRISKYNKLTQEEKEIKHEWWEAVGAIEAFLTVAIIGACYYYFVIRRKRMREPQYVHVVPSGPTFA